eukprot:3273689-Amphidinium_carterae.1
MLQRCTQSGPEVQVQQKEGQEDRYKLDDVGTSSTSIALSTAGERNGEHPQRLFDPTSVLDSCLGQSGAVLKHIRSNMYSHPLRSKGTVRERVQHPIEQQDCA